MHVPTEVRSAAVRMPCGRLCLLPRLSVSIVFKMFSCQSFKILRLFGIARLGEYRGAFLFHCLSVPSPFRFGCLGLTACVPCVAACQSLTPLSVPAASRFSPRPHDTMSGAVSAGRPAACSAGRRTGRVCGLVVDAMRPCLCLVHACLGSLTAMPLSVSSPLLRSRMASPLARSHHACDTLSPPPLYTGDGEPGGANACSAVRR